MATLHAQVEPSLSGAGLPRQGKLPSQEHHQDLVRGRRTAAIDKPATFLLPTAILQQDSVVIDEQENHIVMTLRVPIDLIRDNLTTLMALSQIATGKPMAPAEPEKGDLDG